MMEVLFQIIARDGWDELRVLPLNDLRHNGRRDEDGHQLLLPRPHGCRNISSLFSAPLTGYVFLREWHSIPHDPDKSAEDVS